MTPFLVLPLALKKDSKLVSCNKLNWKWFRDDLNALDSKSFYYLKHFWIPNLNQKNTYFQIRLV